MFCISLGNMLGPRDPSNSLLVLSKGKSETKTKNLQTYKNKKFANTSVIYCYLKQNIHNISIRLIALNMVPQWCHQYLLNLFCTQYQQMSLAFV